MTSGWLRKALRKRFLTPCAALLAGAGPALADGPPNAPPPRVADDSAGHITLVQAPPAGGPTAVPAGSIPPDEGTPVLGATPTLPPGQLWGSAEYLYWWLSDSRMQPVAAATSLPSGT